MIQAVSWVNFMVAGWQDVRKMLILIQNHSALGP
jgi:hypothetical protein